MSVDNTSRSYLDFSGLGQLKGLAAQNQGQALRKTAEQFEAHFLQEIMKTMRQATLKSELTESDSIDTYQDMMDKEVALQMSQRGGIGLADMLEKQMKQQESLSTQSFLDAREVGKKTVIALPLHPQATAGLPLRPEAAPALTLPTHGAIALEARPGQSRTVKPSEEIKHE